MTTHRPLSTAALYTREQLGELVGESLETGIADELDQFKTEFSHRAFDSLK